MGRKNKSKRQGTQLQTQQDSGVFTGASPSSRQELAERLQDMRLDKAKEGKDPDSPECLSVSADPSNVKIFCQYCMKPEPTGAKFPKCSRCRAMHYCSVECQKAHWPTHKKDCQRTIETKERISEGPQATLAERYQRWRNKHHGLLSSLVHSILGRERLRTHVVMMTVAYHTGDKPGFEVEAAQLVSLDELKAEDVNLHRQITAQMADALRMEQTFYAQNGYETRTGLAITMVSHALPDEDAFDPTGFISISPYGIHGEEKAPEGPDDYIQWLNSVSRQ